jgi:hypothetical protein
VLQHRYGLVGMPIKALWKPSFSVKFHLSIAHSRIYGHKMSNTLHTLIKQEFWERFWIITFTISCYRIIWIWWMGFIAIRDTHGISCWINVREGPVFEEVQSILTYRASKKLQSSIACRVFTRLATIYGRFAL